MSAQAVATRVGRRTAVGLDLSTVLQPIVDLISGRVVGVESLARFADERPPDAHFAEAATAGTGLALELAAVRAGLSRIGELPRSAYMTINVSPETATSSELATILDDAPAKRVVLELTEHAPVGDYAQLERGLSPLRARGMRVAIDDAGAGFASMRHVLALRPDVVKIDVSIIRGIDDDPGRREFVRALVSFSRATGCTLVAEGIETQEELAAVRALGVGCGQGFHLGRPARAAAGPWQLSLPPLRGAHLPQLKGKWGRVARPVAVLLAAMLSWPGIVAVAGLRAPWAVEHVTDRAPAEPLSPVGGSTQAPHRAPTSATVLHSVTKTTTTARSAVVHETALPKIKPPVKRPAVTDTVTGVVGVVDQTVGGVLDTAGSTVKAVTKTLGGLLGGKNSLL